MYFLSNYATDLTILLGPKSVSVTTVDLGENIPKHLNNTIIKL